MVDNVGPTNGTILKHVQMVTVETDSITSSADTREFNIKNGMWVAKQDRLSPLKASRWHLESHCKSISDLRGSITKLSVCLYYLKLQNCQRMQNQSYFVDSSVILMICYEIKILKDTTKILSEKERGYLFTSVWSKFR